MKYTKSDMKNLVILKKYTDERLDELLAGRESLSERELAELDIPINDRLWLLGRLCADESNTVARRIAMDVIPLLKRPVPKVVMRYLETGESDIKDAAWYAAWDAAGAAWAAAWAAAWDAACAAARAAWYAACAAACAAAIDAACAAAGAAGSAAWYAAWDSAGDAARAAAMEKYLDWMVEFCESRENG
jgi:hypothetical protein